MCPTLWGTDATIWLTSHDRCIIVIWRKKKSCHLLSCKSDFCLFAYHVFKKVFFYLQLFFIYDCSINNLFLLAFGINWILIKPYKYAGCIKYRTNLRDDVSLTRSDMQNLSEGTQEKNMIIFLYTCFHLHVTWNWSAAQSSWIVYSTGL